MTKPWPEPTRKRTPTDGRVRVRFLADCTHDHLPMAAGDEITVEPHIADRIERFGCGRRVDTSPAHGAKE